MIYEETTYGFRFGAAHVQRYVSHNGYVTLGIETPRQQLKITVTPSGLIRVGQVNRAFRKEGK